MTRASTKSKANASEEVDEQNLTEDQLAERLGDLEVHESGVALDTNDPDYEQLKRIQDLKVEIERTTREAASAGSEGEQSVRNAQLDLEEARLKAQLQAAQNAARAASKGEGVSGLLADAEEQRKAAEAAAKANSEGNK